MQGSINPYKVHGLTQIWYILNLSNNNYNVTTMTSFSLFYRTQRCKWNE